jgi:uncharacterized protein (DUF697 family)
MRNKENKTETTESIENEEVIDPEIRALEASAIIKNHMMAAMGFGVIPIPIVDLIGLTGTQLNMLRKLSALYGHDFSEELAKKSIASLLGAGLTLPVAMGLSSLVKIIPVIGQTAGIISLATTGTASTYAIGRVFVKHFESGGDFLSFSSKEAKDEFDKELEKGKEEASNLDKKTEVA